ncbi:uncharacterized protein LOC111349827 [Spodoptera litura]|uniref:Uncharacterized protein LOC111349827 n=1 Tax=Spodoptera litura TaxID=69820 RepID=A0A9J7DUE1_SPOLT|nr:uncharacterized protein LOC111349827 [Spodoptera litura]
MYQAKSDQIAYTKTNHRLPQSENVVADALSRVEEIHPPLNYQTLANEQNTDNELQELLTSGSTLKLVKMRTPDSDLHVYCDVSTSSPRPYITPAFRKQVFDSLHNLSHAGTKATVKLVTQRFVWPGIKRDCRKWVKTCQQCQRSKVTRHTTAPLASFQPPSARFRHIHLDLIGPLPLCSGYRYCLTIVDRFTRWPEAYPLQDISADTCATALIQGWISRFGCPEDITTDRGSQFLSHTFKELATLISANHHTTTSYHPAANGLVERMHRQLKSAITCHASPNWVEILPWVLLGIRSSWKEDLQTSAAELVYGEPLRLPGQFFSSDPGDVTDMTTITGRLRAHVSRLKPMPTSWHGIASRPFYVPKDLAKASHVFVRHGPVKRPLQAPYAGPYKVLHRSQKTFDIDIQGKTQRISIDRLKPAYVIKETPQPTSYLGPTGDQNVVQKTRSGRVNLDTLAPGDCTFCPATDSSKPPPDITMKPGSCPTGVWTNIRHPTLCNSFYYCNGNKSVQFFCVDGYEYDPSRGCVEIAEGGCTLQSTITTEAVTVKLYLSICAVDPNGNIPHPEMCNSFYNCTGGQATQLNCTDGFEFDPNVNSCVPIAEGGCTMSKATTPRGETTAQHVPTTAAPETTEQEVVTTAAPETTEQEVVTTAAPETTEQEVVTTAAPETTTQNVTTTAAPMTTEQEVTTTVAPMTTEQEVTTTVAPTMTTLAPTTASDDIPDVGTTTKALDDTTTAAVDTTNEAPICAPDVCGVVPHPDRCDTFYLCSAGNALPFTCSKELEFDPETKSCVPIAEGGCTLSKATTPAGEYTVQEVTTTAAPTTTTLAPTTASDDIPDDDTTTRALDDTTTAAVDTTNEDICAPGEYGNIPHPDRCDAYYFCFAGNAFLFTCTEELEFDPKTKSCVPIAKGGCTCTLSKETAPGCDCTVNDKTTTVAPKTTEQKVTTTAAPKTTVKDITTTVAPKTTTLAPTTASDDIPDDGTTTKAFVGTTTVSVDTTTEDPICPPSVFGYVPHPDRCDAYYLCSGGKAHLFNCSGELEFDPGTESCVLIAKGGCTLSKGCDWRPGKTTVKDQTTTAAPETTAQDVTTTAAPETTAQDVTTTAAPETTAQDVTTTVAPETTAQDVTTTAAPETTVQDVTITVAPKTTTLAPTTASDDILDDGTTTKALIDTTTQALICAPGVFGNVPHPDRCDAHYLCTDGNAVLTTCDEGLEYNPESRTCIPIAKGGCTMSKGDRPEGETTVNVKDVTTTAAPKTTVKDVTTTAAPKTTVQDVPIPAAPKTTVQDVPIPAAPKTTVQDVTTTAASKTTVQDVTTTAAPKTTVQDVTTTAAPKTTVQDVTTTAAPKTTVQDVTTTAAPETTVQDVTTTAAPKSTSRRRRRPKVITGSIYGNTDGNMIIKL